MAIEVREYKPGEFVILKDGTINLGTFRKIKNTRTETFPWQAFSPRCELLGSWYGRDGKRRAIEKILVSR